MAPKLPEVIKLLKSRIFPLLIILVILICVLILVLFFPASKTSSLLAKAINNFYFFYVEISRPAPQTGFSEAVPGISSSPTSSPSPIASPACTDSDGSGGATTNYYLNYNERGHASSSYDYGEDYCSTKHILVEYYCSSQQAPRVSQTSQDCGAFRDRNGNPKVCGSGACRPDPERDCTDSDGGKVYETRGTTTGTDPSDGESPKTETDYCVLVNNIAPWRWRQDCMQSDLNNYPGSHCELWEFYCNGVYVEGESIVCAGPCINGACSPAPMPSPSPSPSLSPSLSLSPSPSPFPSSSPRPPFPFPFPFRF